MGRGAGRGRGRGWGRGQGLGHGLRRFLDPVLLLRLHFGAAHGYSLLEGLEEFGLGELDPSVVYRALREMEEEGWVSSTWDAERTQGPPRRTYRLTDGGHEVLDLWVQELEGSRTRIERFLAAYHGHMKECQGHDDPADSAEAGPPRARK
jgi:PadR family transcriptional regulator PadR